MSKKTIGNAVASNPLLILFLGACPAMGATATAQGALGMGAAVLVVLLLSGVTIAALHKIIPAAGRLPVSVLVIAGFVSIVQMLMNAFLPNIYGMLGIYLTVAAVDLLIFGTDEAADSGMGTVVSAALKTGVQFLAVLLVVGIVREVLGSAAVFGAELSALKDYRIPVLAMAPGGFLVYSFTAAVVSKLNPAARLTGTGAACAAAGIGSIPCEEVAEV